MDYLPWIILAVALVFFCSSYEHFSRFEDTSNRKRTDKVINSSYSQQTNHAIPQTGQFGPVQGMETPFRVNIWNASL
jgi:hypothetical protein